MGLPENTQKDIAYSIIWQGICEECAGGAFKEDFREGRQKLYDYDVITQSLQRYSNMLWAIELACGWDWHCDIMSRLVQAAIEDCNNMRSDFQWGSLPK